MLPISLLGIAIEYFLFGFQKHVIDIYSWQKNVIATVIP